MLTAKLSHGLYHDATVVDYNLILKFLIIGDVKVSSSCNLQKIENYSTLVIQNKCKQVLPTCNVVCTMLSPYMGISWQSADSKHTIFVCDS